MQNQIGKKKLKVLIEKMVLLERKIGSKPIT